MIRKCRQRGFLGAASLAVLIAMFLLPPENIRGDDQQKDSPPNVDAVVTLLGFVLEADENTARECLDKLTRAIQSGQVPRERVGEIREQLSGRLGAILQDEAHPLRFDAALLATAWNDADGRKIAAATLASADAAPERRLAALQALIAASADGVLEDAGRILDDGDESSTEFRGQVLAALGRLDRNEVAELVLTRFTKLDPALQPRAIELLTQRPAWTRSLLAAIAAERIEKGAINLNQLRRIAAFNDEELQQQFQEIYGALREGRDPQREQLVARMRDVLSKSPGDPHRGIAAFKKVCGQCHKIYGDGAEVGPDITRNGRNNWDQLLSNVFDPSLVIGPGYQARQLVTEDGRVLTGLPVEESEQRVVLKVQGGKLETIARDQIEVFKVSELSMMPEQLENQLSEQEIVDLMAFLALDRHPDDPEARYLPGAPQFESQ